MKPKDFARLLERDQGYCLHCGETEALSPNHRINRGMGGSKLRDNPSNLVVICSILNGLIESDNRWAKVAEDFGWKLRSWEDTLSIATFDSMSGKWFRLNDDFTRTEVEGREP